MPNSSLRVHANTVNDTSEYEISKNEILKLMSASFQRIKEKENTRLEKEDKKLHIVVNDKKILSLEIIDGKLNIDSPIELDESTSIFFDCFIKPLVDNYINEKFNKKNSVKVEIEKLDKDIEDKQHKKQDESNAWLPGPESFTWVADSNNNRNFFLSKENSTENFKTYYLRK